MHSGLQLSFCIFTLDIFGHCPVGSQPQCAPDRLLMAHAVWNCHAVRQIRQVVKTTCLAPETRNLESWPKPTSPPHTASSSKTVPHRHRRSVWLVGTGSRLAAPRLQAGSRSAGRGPRDGTWTVRTALMAQVEVHQTLVKGFMEKEDATTKTTWECNT